MESATPTLFILSGLPGVGKSTLGKALARHTGAVYLRIDAIEQGLRDAGLVDLHVHGYAAAYRLAEENLRLGFSVVADSCNPIAVTREQWHRVAERGGATGVDIEVVCSDREEHRQRVEGRMPEIDGHRLPTWSEVVDRTYDPWTRDRIVIDTSQVPIEVATRTLFQRLFLRAP